ncbi:alpha-2A adrenergic receptor [Nelusetta ayraudi]|uniref:alpha-2A adrenergic receptor n=1 Tax=Nelusetta ayraudi TaxID=303726 RepID=UPI003F6F1B7C
MEVDNSTANGTVGGGRPQYPYSLQVSLCLTLLVGALILLTVFGNALVVAAVLSGGQRGALRAPQNLYLVSLACADVLVAALVMPLSLANELLGGWPLGRACCRAYLALDVLLCTASIAHLCAIALDRYCSVARAPGHSLRRTPRRVKRAIAAVWLAAALISCPPLLWLRDGEDPEQRQTPRCEINNDRWYVISSCIGSFFLPCAIMLLLYLRIYHIAKQRSRRRPAAPPPGLRGALQPPPPPVAATVGKSNGVGGAEEQQQQQQQQQLKMNGEQEAELREEVEEVEAAKEEELLKVDEHCSPKKKKEEEKKKKKEKEMMKEEEEEEEEEGDDLEESTSSDLKVNDPRSGKENVENVEEEEAAGGTRLCRVTPGCDPQQGALSGRGQSSGRAQGSRGALRRRRQQQQQREKRLTLVLALVLGVFVLCWFPFFFSYTLLTLCPHCALPPPLFKFFFWFGYCNSALNPLIYTLFNHDFRRSFRSILCRHCISSRRSRGNI